MRAGKCRDCKTELRMKRIFGFRVKYCRVCMELKKKDNTQL